MAEMQSQGLVLHKILSDLREAQGNALMRAGDADEEGREWDAASWEGQVEGLKKAEHLVQIYLKKIQASAGENT